MRVRLLPFTCVNLLFDASVSVMIDRLLCTLSNT